MQLDWLCPKFILERLVYTFFSDIGKAETFQPYRIGVPAKLPDWARSVLRGVAGQGTVVSSSITAPRGTYRSGDVVWISAPRTLALVKLAVLVPRVAGDNRLLFIVKPFVSSLGGGWSDVLGELVVVDVDSTTCS